MKTTNQIKFTGLYKDFQKHIIKNNRVYTFHIVDELKEENLLKKQKKIQEDFHGIRTEKLKKDIEKGIESLEKNKGIIADDDFYDRVIKRGEKRLKNNNT